MDIKLKVFPVEERPDVLIVSPRGDAIAFDDNDVKLELSTLQNLVTESSSRSMLVDFSGSNYFGSTIIGCMIKLATQVKEQNGKVALFGTSDDMQAILRTMNLHKIWIEFDDREEALRWLTS